MKNKRLRLILRMESILNKTPNISIFIICCTIFLLILSFVLSIFSGEYVYQFVDPFTLEQTQRAFEVKNMLSLTNLVELISNSTLIYASLPSIFIIIITLLSFGVAEKSGYLYTVFKSLLFWVPKSIVTFILIFVGFVSGVAGNGDLNAGYLFLLPLSAFIFIGSNRNPLAGIAAMFAAIFGGFSINFLLTSQTLVTNDITEVVSRYYISSFEITGVSDRYIMFALVIIGSLFVTLLTERYILNILPLYDLEIYTYHKITVNEKRGLLFTLIYTVLTILIYIYLLLPPAVTLPGAGYLLGEYDRSSVTYFTQLVNSPFMNTFVAHISYYLLFSGIIYGLASKKFRSLNEIIKSSVVAIADHAEFFVLFFFLSQLSYVLYNSNIGLFIMFQLTNLLGDSNSILFILASVILVTAIVNIFIPATVTKWAVMAPIIVPLFISDSINPIVAQTAFMIGDSATNIITIMLPYTLFTYVLFNAYAKKTKQHCGNGTYLKLTLPYSFMLLAVYSITIFLWVLLNLNLGSNTGILL